MWIIKSLKKHKKTFKPVLSNLGFLFQISGIFMFPSIVYAFLVDEVRTAAALLSTAVVFMASGFFLNALSEKKMLNMKQSSILLILYYALAPLISSISYLSLGIFEGSFMDRLLNSWFETSSAMSTTGLTLLEGVTMPKPMVLARAMTEWGGGIGIIFILLSNFYPSRSLFHYGKVLGIEKITSDYKKSFMTVLAIYIFYTFIFSGALILSGLDVFTAFQLTFTILSSTGLTIVNVMNLSLAVLVIVTIMMLFSALSFSFHTMLVSSIFKRDWKGFTSYISDWKRLAVKELLIYIVFLGFSAVVFALLSGLEPYRAFFHVVDMSSSCGLNVIPFDRIGEAGKIFLALVMLIGPCSFSTGGGMKIIRIYILGKALYESPKILLTGQSPRIKIEDEYLKASDFMVHLLIIILYVAISFLAAMILCNYGYTFSDALVESVSAITTTGDSPKTLAPSLPWTPKLLLGILMILGRIEIIPLLIAVSPVKEEN